MAAIHFLSIIIVLCLTVLRQTLAAPNDSGSRTVLHDSALSDQVQSDILHSLGISDPSNISAQGIVLDYTQRLALQQIIWNAESTSGSHFMAENSDLLLVAKKGKIRKKFETINAKIKFY